MSSSPAAAPDGLALRPQDSCDVEAAAVGEGEAEPNPVEAKVEFAPDGAVRRRGLPAAVRVDPSLLRSLPQGRQEPRQ